MTDPTPALAFIELPPIPAGLRIPLFVTTGLLILGSCVAFYLWFKRQRDRFGGLRGPANALRLATPDSLRTQAQTIRGKVNVLSRLSGKPVKTRIVLTHMDQVEGYLAFSEFLEKSGIPLQLDLSGGAEKNLETILAPYE